MLVLALILIRLAIFCDVNTTWYYEVTDGEFDVGEHSQQHQVTKVLTYAHRDLVGRRFHRVWTGQFALLRLPVLDISVPTDTSGPRAPPGVA